MEGGVWVALKRVDWASRETCSVKGKPRVIPHSHEGPVALMKARELPQNLVWERSETFLVGGHPKRFWKEKFQNVPSNAQG